MQLSAVPVRIFRVLAPTFRYWSRTEVHVYAFSIAANVLLSFFPFLIVSMSVARLFFDQKTTVAALDVIFRDYLPGALSQFLHEYGFAGRANISCAITDHLVYGKPFATLRAYGACILTD